MKICYVASSGGHWEELMCLRDIVDHAESVYITEAGGQVSDSKLDHLYLLPQINRREAGFLPHFVKLCIQSAKILKAEKPDVLISTGALIAFPFCVWAKLSGVKIIYIESFARVNSKSLTGKMVYPFADLFIVQWETMLEVYPKAKYIGGIF